MRLFISNSVWCAVYVTLFRDYLAKQKFVKLIVSDAPATKLGHAVRRTTHASRDGERRHPATETGKLYRLPTETKNVYVVLSAVQERLCLCLQPEHTQTHTPCLLENLEESYSNNILYFLTRPLQEYLEMIHFAVCTINTRYRMIMGSILDKNER